MVGGLVVWAVLKEAVCPESYREKTFRGEINGYTVVRTQMSSYRAIMCSYLFTVE